MNAKLLLTMMGGMLLASLAYSQDSDPALTYNSGGTESFFDREVDGWVSVEDSGSGVGTTLIISEGVSEMTDIFGGEDDDVAVKVSGQSSLVYSGGNLWQDIWAIESSTVTMTGGLLKDDLIGDDNSQLYVSGGTIVDDLELYGTSFLELSGGSIEEDLELFDGSTGYMTRGKVLGDVAVLSDASLFILGGDLNESSGLYSVWGGSMTIYGSGFSLDRSYVTYGTAYSDVNGLLLSGTLSDGSSISLDLFVDEDSSVTFLSSAAVPEPSSYAAFIGVLCIIGFGIRKRMGGDEMKGCANNTTKGEA